MCSRMGVSCCVCVCVCERVAQNIKYGARRFGRASLSVMLRVCSTCSIGENSFVVDIGSGDGCVVVSCG